MNVCTLVETERLESTVAWSATVDITDSRDRDNMRVGIRGGGKQEKEVHITDTKIKSYLLLIMYMVMSLSNLICTVFMLGKVMLYNIKGIVINCK